MRVIILTAGLGTRFYPFSAITKSLFPVLDKPLIGYLLESLSKYSSLRIDFVVSLSNHEVIEHYVRTRHPSLNCRFIVQSQQKGSGDALLQAYLSEPQQWSLVLNGDILVHDNLINKAVSYLQNKKALVFGMKVEDPREFGVFLYEDKDDVLLLQEIIEKPPPPFPSHLANAGIYVFPPDIHSAIQSVKKSGRGEFEIPDAINSLLRREETPVFIEIINDNEYWLDLGYPWRVLEANELLMKDVNTRITGDIEDNVHYRGNIVIEKGAKVRSGVYLEGNIFIDKDAVVGPNSYIRGTTYIGVGAKVGSSCEVKNSIILKGASISHLNYVGDSVIGEGCNLGSGTTVGNLKFDDSNVIVSFRGKEIQTNRRKLGVCLGNNTKTGTAATFSPGVLIGSNCIIGANTLVNKSLEPNTRYFSTFRDIVEKKR